MMAYSLELEDRIQLHPYRYTIGAFIAGALVALLIVTII
jgi:hypothetical protein